MSRLIPKEIMRRSRTTRHEILGHAALFSSSVAVSDEIYSRRQSRWKRLDSTAFVS